MLLSLGKLLGIAIASGGGFTAYYLAKSSSYQDIYQKKSILESDCNSPYLVKPSVGGIFLPMDTKKHAEEFLRDHYRGEGEIVLQEKASCPH